MKMSPIAGCDMKLRYLQTMKAGSNYYCTTIDSSLLIASVNCLQIESTFIGFNL
jgi:hypothetical protein